MIVIFKHLHVNLWDWIKQYHVMVRCRVHPWFLLILLYFYNLYYIYFLDFFLLFVCLVSITLSYMKNWNILKVIFMKAKYKIFCLVILTPKCERDGFLDMKTLICSNNCWICVDLINHGRTRVTTFNYNTNIFKIFKYSPNILQERSKNTSNLLDQHFL